MQVSAEENPQFNTETPKNIKEAEAPFAERLLSKIQAIKAEVGPLKQNVNLSRS